MNKDSLKHNYYRPGLEKGWELARLNRKPEHEFICLYCGISFHRRGKNINRVKYCSLKCKYEDAKGRANPQIVYRNAMALLATKEPELGEVRTALGTGIPNAKEARQWIECPICHTRRWVRYRKERTITGICKQCHNEQQRQLIGEKHHCWKGGRRISHKGYVEIRLSPNDFFYPMVNKSGSVLEHRLIMAKHLGRCLQPWEVVHHKNHIKTDNRIANLRLHTIIHHSQITIIENRISYLENRVLILEAENTLLKEQLNAKNYNPYTILP